MLAMPAAQYSGGASVNDIARQMWFADRASKYSKPITIEQNAAAPWTDAAQAGIQSYLGNKYKGTGTY
jgi:hypothetical protein